jgi:magnesium-transporting ATPase (P-type)
MKSSLPKDDKMFSYLLNKKCVLYHGTKVKQCESNLLSGKMRVLAINTGFNTNRGNLIQNILFPRKTNAKFYKDTLFFVIGMIVVYIISSVIIILVYNVNNDGRKILDNNNYINFIGISMGYTSADKVVYTIHDLIKKLLFNLVIIMPPTLPICTTFTSFYFQYNLKKKSISCVEDSKMTIAGRLNTIVLDKTGTLTEEGLELHGFQSTILSYKRNESVIDTNNFALYFDEIELSSSIYNMVLKDFYKRIVNAHKDESFIEDDEYRKSYKYNMVYFLECLACCHSIDILKGMSFGNSVDKKIFENLDWIQTKASEDLGIGKLNFY